MADKNCYECDGTGWMDDMDSVGCGDRSCCSPAVIRCPVCNPAGDNPIYDNREPTP